MSTDIILEIGSGRLRAGFSGEDTPRAVFPSAVAEMLNGPALLDSTSSAGPWFGSDALAKEIIATLTFPVRAGQIEDWERWKALLDYTFNSVLHTDPTDRNVLIIEPPQTTRAKREKMTESLFEDFGVAGFYVANSALMALHAARLVTGLVVECGADLTIVTPVIDGHLLPSSIAKSPVAGKAIDAYINFELKRTTGQNYPSRVVQAIKEQLGYIARDYERELAGFDKATWVLPDGTKIEVGQQRLSGPEVLFTPSVAGLAEPGLTALVNKAIYDSAPETREALASSIVIAGGSTMFPGFAERLQADLAKSGMTGARITAVNERKHSAWVGASILSSPPSFQDRWMTRDEYSEDGTALIHLKCFS